MSKYFKNNILYTNTLSKCNEDRGYSSDGFLFVIDGATGLYGTNITPLASDAAWYADTIANHLKEALQDRGRTLAAIVNESVALVSDAYDTIAGEQEMDIIGYPSATCSIVRINGNVLEYITVGDSPIIVMRNSGEVEAIHERRLVALDRSATIEVVSYAERNNISNREAIPHIKELLRSNRALANTPDGYNSLSRDVTVGDRALGGTIEVDDIRLIAILSDGFAQHYDLLKCSDGAKEFLLRLDDTTPEELYGEIIARQNSDKDYNLYPRFKLSDDATIAIGVMSD